MHAQAAGATAVVVTDNEDDPVRWKMIMSGAPEHTQGIYIPAVFVSSSTGEKLWRNRPWNTLRGSINATDHVPLVPTAIGPLETLGVYLLVFCLLIALSGVCGVLIALSIAWYQRGHRLRAMRKLKSFKFRRARVCHDSGSNITNSGTLHTHTTSGLSREPSVIHQGAPEELPTPHKGASQDISGETSGAQDLGIRAHDDTCAICLDLYEDGEGLTSLPCRHFFHSNCIRPWLSGKSVLCPMCKREAFTCGGRLSAAASRLEVAMAELATLCPDNLLLLVMIFSTSVTCGAFAAYMSVRP